MGRRIRDMPMLVCALGEAGCAQEFSTDLSRDGSVGVSRVTLVAAQHQVCALTEEVPMIPPLDTSAEGMEAILRHEFIYWLTVTVLLGDPSDWPRFRVQLVRALASAFFFDTDRGLGARAESDELAAARQHELLELLDETRESWEPDRNWTGFVLELWEQRVRIRAVWVPTPPRPPYIRR